MLVLLNDEKALQHNFLFFLSFFFFFSFSDFPMLVNYHYHAPKLQTFETKQKDSLSFYDQNLSKTDAMPSTQFLHFPIHALKSQHSKTKTLLPSCK